MFRQRSGATQSGEYSPIFIQFLDCVWQIWRQYPWEFEFTDKLLLTLIYGLTSRFCDDFIYDNQKQQVEHNKIIKLVIKEEHCPDCTKNRSRKCSFAAGFFFFFSFFSCFFVIEIIVNFVRSCK